MVKKTNEQRDDDEVAKSRWQRGENKTKEQKKQNHDDKEENIRRRKTKPR